MYVITVDFEIHAEHLAAFREAMLENARASVENEPGCRHFDVCEDPDAPSHIFLYELYDDAAAFKAHLAAAHFKQFDATVGPWVKSKQVRVLTRL